MITKIIVKVILIYRYTIVITSRKGPGRDNYKELALFISKIEIFTVILVIAEWLA